MTICYRIREFAELAGVTVKALLHYDRLGLLEPRRSGSGYRVYTDRDLARLEQIVALKFLGFPLKQIKTVLDRTAGDWPDALGAQRAAIEEKHAQLGRAIKAICAVEEAAARGEPIDPAALTRIIEVISMQDDVEAMKKYYSEEAWQVRRRYYTEGPSAEWQQLYRDVTAVLDEDPGGERAQAVAERWLALSVRAIGGEPEAQTDSATAWMDRENWPEAMKQRVEAFNLETVYAFIRRAAESCGKKYFRDDAWEAWLRTRHRSTEEVSRLWQARVDLFHDVEAALGEDPASEKARTLAARWAGQFEAAGGGHAGVREGLLKLWADRKRWSPVQRWQAEALHMMPFDRFARAADFIDRAAAARVDV